MLKLLLNKVWTVEATPIAVAMSAGSVMVTLRGKDGALYEFTLITRAARPSECDIELRRANG